MSVVSKLTGADAASHAGDAMKAGQQQQAAAQNIYGQLGGEGSTLTGDLTTNLPGLLAAFGSASNIGQPGSWNVGNGGYNLTPAQQTQLNGQNDLLQRQQEGVTNHIKSDYARRGITDTSAIEAQIANQYNALRSQGAASFQENARQNQQNASLQLLQYLQGIGGLGTNAQTAAAGGNAGLAGQSNQLAQQQTAASNAALGNLLSLGTAAATGGFSTGAKAAQSVAAPDYSTGPFSPITAGANPANPYNY